MKKIKGILFIVVAAITFVSCEPVEKRLEMDNNRPGTTMAEIDRLVRVVQIEREDGGVMYKSNFFSFYSDHLTAVGQFRHGMGTYTGTKGDTIQGTVMEGPITIVFTARNPDGTTIEKPFDFVVERAFDLGPLWEFLTGGGKPGDSRTWEWNERENDKNAAGPPYFMGDIYNYNGRWWSPSTYPNDKFMEGPGATMTFHFTDVVFEKTRTDGSVEKGTFVIDMFSTLANYDQESSEERERGVWSMAQLKTSMPVLIGESTGGAEVLVYEIVALDDDILALSWLDNPSHDFYNEGWGQATWWIFKPVKEDDDE